MTKPTGRRATAAHPLCICGKWKRSYCTRDWVFTWHADDHSGMPDGMRWAWVDRVENFLPEDCPMHGGTA